METCLACSSAAALHARHGLWRMWATSLRQIVQHQGYLGATCLMPGAIKYNPGDPPSRENSVYACCKPQAFES